MIFLIDLFEADRIERYDMPHTKPLRGSMWGLVLVALFEGMMRCLVLVTLFEGLMWGLVLVALFEGFAWGCRVRI